MYETTQHDNLNITSISLGEMNTNCYFIWDTKSREAVVIDPADSGEFLAETLSSMQLKPMAIVFTHAHFDHVLGAFALTTLLQLPTWLHSADTPLLARAQKSAEHWLRHSVDPVIPATNLITNETTFELGATTLSILHLPGHTPGSIGIGVFGGSAPFICSGDLITSERLGSTNHRYSSVSDFAKSLQKLSLLPKTTTYYPGHGKAIVAEQLAHSVQ